MYELYKGCEVIVDYYPTHDSKIIDFFEEDSNFEGYSRLKSIDYDKGVFRVEGLKRDISLKYLIAINELTNEFDYIIGA